MLIQTNVAKPLPTEVLVHAPDGKQFAQDISYDWKPDFCEKCQKIGHVCPQQVVVEPPQFEEPRRRRKGRETLQEAHPVQHNLQQN